MKNRYQIIGDLKGIRIVWKFLFIEWTIKRFWNLESAVDYLNKHYKKD